MKRTSIYALAATMLAACSGADADVTINLPEDYAEPSVVVTHVTIDNIFTARSADDIHMLSDTLPVKAYKATLRLDPAGPARYSIQSPVPSRTEPEFYAAPGEKLRVDIKAFEPLEYTVSGTPLMDDLTALNAITTPIQQDYMRLADGGDVTEAQAKDYMDRYDAAIKAFVAAHPKSPAVPFAILDLSGDDFKAVYDSLTPEARKSILMPYAELYNTHVEQMQQERQAEQDRQAEMASGTIQAPNFTLPDLAGKQVSLTDFRGKWIVLDFWGSWCGWCIKGFPALKDAYKQYGDRITIIGIDCNDSEADWRAAVKQYELPWICLYNGDNRDLYAAYNIEGFPTKVIINPQGMIVDLTTGEDPSFFTRLATLLAN